ncbi:MAG: serine/threonine protein kinase [Planctomycetota bacterium]|nr:serine/threonine protein kinase [Planctomycetaceae bacterium]MDQ3332222.1 serine/threonine protein kinase [Planctomycetota bacterium]
MLHANGIIHRDLKPANIDLSEDGKLKLGDFGLAKDAFASKLTLDGQTVGTIRFMAPEQIRGRQDIDGRLDLYALGCILFRCAAGRLPIDGANPLETFEGHLHMVPPRLDTIVANCPKSFAVIVARLLEKDPAARPANGNVVARVLAAVLENPDRAVTDEDFAENGERDAPSDANIDASGTANLAERLRSATTEAAREIGWKKLAVVLAVAAIGVMIVIFTRRS